MFDIDRMIQIPTAAVKYPCENHFFFFYKKRSLRLGSLTTKFEQQPAVNNNIVLSLKKVERKVRRKGEHKTRGKY